MQSVSRTHLLRVCACVLAAHLSGCASEPLRDAAPILEERPVEEVVADVENLAQQCWSREENFFRHDGIVVDVERSQKEGVRIVARRFARDIPPQPPFFVATVLPREGGSRVRVQERSYACGLTSGCYSLGFGSELAAWLGGARACARR